ncbi:MAG: tetratricopeptide repeat protein, partial [Deltaproteobacteria bacterium]|nr:tetratricopeptide repeat protein [Deltaproteobacteria bacterium]
AVDDYRQLIRLSPQRERRRAQYRAAAILQDELADHFGAIALLEKYVSSAQASDALGAEARIRLARSYMKVGNRAKAETLLASVISRYPGTPAATRARQMLDDM